jgi:hypothetical protein
MFVYIIIYTIKEFIVSQSIQFRAHLSIFHHIFRISLSAASHCCHFDKYSNFIALGTTAGGVSIYSFMPNTSSSSGKISMFMYTYKYMNLHEYKCA